MPKLSTDERAWLEREHDIVIDKTGTNFHHMSNSYQWEPIPREWLRALYNEFIWHARMTS